MPFSFSILVPLAALAAVLGLLPLLIGYARRTGFVDRPGGRKKHDDAVPPVGGLVVFPVFALGTALTGVPLASWCWYYAALALLLAVGAWDDRHTVRPVIKFAAQFIAAGLVVIPGGAAIVTMGNILGLGPLVFGWMSIPFSVVAVVLLINAVNLMDGLDGLAGGVGFMAALCLAAGALLGGAPGNALVCAVLMAALAGFLFYNMRSPVRSRAVVFMGDSGSLALGLTIGWLAITMSAQDAPPAIMPMSVAWILALPIFDICGQFARRVSQGRHPFDADHNHFHHHFINAGLPVGRATATILAIALGGGLIGIAGMAFGVPQMLLSWPWIALLLAHIYLSLRPHRFRRLIMRLRGAGAA